MMRLVSAPRGFAVSPWRARAVPIISTVLGSCLSLLPFVAELPLFPDTGLLMALGWRLLRPELWRAHVALGLGLANDLILGLPFGQSAALWTLIFLGCDLADRYFSWRGYWTEWLIAAPAALFAGAGGWYLARVAGSGAPFSLYLPPIAMTILLFPLAVRLCAALDRWRLNR